jgi:hypothetical protein
MSTRKIMTALAVVALVTVESPSLAILGNNAILALWEKKGNRSKPCK